MGTNITESTSPAERELINGKLSAEIAKLNAEERKFLDEAAYFEAQTRNELAEAEAAEIAVRSKRRGENILLAQDDYHKVYVFDEAVTDDSVKKCITYMSTWSRQDPGSDIEIHVNTHGGDIFAGFALIDYIRGLRTRGHKITAVAYGMAASMGAVLLQAADVRAIGANSFMLIHEGALGAAGDFGHVEDNLAMMKKLHTQILDLLSERAVIKRAAIIKNWKRKDWWISAAEALEHGLVDEIR